MSAGRARRRPLGSGQGERAHFAAAVLAAGVPVRFAVTDDGIAFYAFT